ncbi:nucleotide-binding universal stress UspA family protein [Roseimicrobium gellanilyticum]|uniref:Nucleotide-binding universal stress UspA family protein n=1 Tax=Roseimicrobium gellanilyticum TaxID=748857 RepID=A0A366HRZ3_9BACT|nr:universal stress protein [Roseimicrobium gellanilyticum]RBP46451.1 nucleotide-binding universal stress UspA family protein [Roseimicrobium gellanilyticum]
MKTAYSTAAPVAESASRVRRILAPTDFSPLSRAAVSATVALVMASPGASVTLLHVVDPSEDNDAEHDAAHHHAPLSTRINQADRWMKELRSQYSIQNSEMLETRIATGSAVQVICDMARDEGFDLLVMSSHGRMGLARMSIGSVAEQVVQQAPCPVLVGKALRNKAGTLTPCPPEFRFSRILVGYDHRAGAQHALDMACALDAREGAHITLVHALEPAPAWPPCSADSQTQALCVHEALVRMAKVQEERMPESRNWDLRVENGEPWDVIVKLAKEADSDLIIVGPHEHTRWGHSYVGSTAQWVVRQAPCPVLVVK